MIVDDHDPAVLMAVDAAAMRRLPLPIKTISFEGFHQFSNGCVA
jgi:hypothetical protein